MLQRGLRFHTEIGFPKEERMTVKTRIRQDTDDDKKYPNGISSAVLAIYQFWHSAGGRRPARPRTRFQFVSRTNFMEVYRRVVAKYPGTKKKPSTPAKIADMLNDLSYGRHDLNYYKLRALAEFINLPTGLFLLFTHCSSLERQSGGSTKSCLEVLDGLQRVIDLTRGLAEQARDPNRGVFMEQYNPAPDCYLPSVESLKAWSDAFNNV